MTPWLEAGLEPQKLSKEVTESLKLPKNISIFIDRVLEIEPTNKISMKPGDVLTEVNNRKVNDIAARLHRIAQTSPGDEAKVALLRRGKAMTL